MENKMEYEIKEETLVVLRTYWFYTIGEVKNDKQECSILTQKEVVLQQPPLLLLYSTQMAMAKHHYHDL